MKLDKYLSPSAHERTRFHVPSHRKMRELHAGCTDDRLRAFVKYFGYWQSNKMMFIANDQAGGRGRSQHMLVNIMLKGGNGGCSSRGCRQRG